MRAERLSETLLSMLYKVVNNDLWLQVAGLLATYFCLLQKQLFSFYSRPKYSPQLISCLRQGVNCRGVEVRGLTLSVHVFAPSLVYSFVLGSEIRKICVRKHAVYKWCYLLLYLVVYTHNTQSPTMSHDSHPLYHILDSSCFSIILPKTFSASMDLTTSTSDPDRCELPQFLWANSYRLHWSESSVI